MSADDWQEDEIALLKAMRAKGDSFGDIAKALKAKHPRGSIGPARSRSACLGKAHRLGLKVISPVRNVRRAIPTRVPRHLADLRDEGDGGVEHRRDIVDLEILDRIAEGCAVADVADAFGEIDRTHIQDLAQWRRAA